MKKSEVARLLAIAAAFDRRTVGESDVAAWHAVLADLHFDEAAFAVRAHFAETDAYLMPAHVRRRVIEGRRLEAERRHDRDVRKMLDAPKPNADVFWRGLARVAEAFAVARGLDGDAERERVAKRRTANSVPCPHCKAAPGRPCVVAGTDRPLTKTASHESRAEAAANS